MNLEPLPPAGKPAVASTGIWGGVAALAGLMLPPILAALRLTPDDAQAATAAIGQIVCAAGVLLGIYGRWKAAQPITSVLPKKDS